MKGLQGSGGEGNELEVKFYASVEKALDSNKTAFKKRNIRNLFLKFFFFITTEPISGLIFILMNVGACYLGLKFCKRLSQFVIALFCFENFDDSFIQNLSEEKVKED